MNVWTLSAGSGGDAQYENQEVKMRKNLKHMHNNFELHLAKSEFNQFTCWASYGGMALEDNKNN